MTRVPPLRSAVAFAASVTLTFVTFQQTAAIPVGPAATVAVLHPGIA